MADRGSNGASHGKGRTCAAASVGAGRAGRLGGRLRVKKARGVSVEQGQVRWMCGTGLACRMLAKARSRRGRLSADNRRSST